MRCFVRRVCSRKQTRNRAHTHNPLPPPPRRPRRNQRKEQALAAARRRAAALEAENGALLAQLEEQRREARGASERYRSEILARGEQAAQLQVTARAAL